MAGGREGGNRLTGAWSGLPDRTTPDWTEAAAAQPVPRNTPMTGALLHGRLRAACAPSAEMKKALGRIISISKECAPLCPAAPAGPAHRKPRRPGRELRPHCRMVGSERPTRAPQSLHLEPDPPRWEDPRGILLSHEAAPPQKTHGACVCREVHKCLCVHRHQRCPPNRSRSWVGEAPFLRVSVLP